MTGSAVRARGAGTAIRGDRGLRPSSFAAVVMLLAEYAFGIWVNLYGKVPASAHGKSAFAAFGAVVTHGPVALAVHALLGTLILVTAISVVIRAALARKVAATVIGALAFLAVIAAWLSGARFASGGADGASFGMAVATAVALLCYAVILFVPRLTAGADR